MSQKEIPETGRLNIGGLNEGVVIDHIQAGGAMKIYEYLNLEKLDCSKDIIKIEGPLDIDLNVLGVLDPNLTINIIKDNNIVAKHKLELPETVTGIIRCKNPRCITSIEQELPHSFKLTDRNRRIYRCIYCESKFKGSLVN